MRIGLCGAHRTGKSTIATSLSNRFGLPIVASSGSAIAEKLGLDLKDEIGLSDRIRYQKAVLASMVENFGHKMTFVSDRTPLDAAAYLLADMGNVTGSPRERSEAVAYVEAAIAATRNFFDALIYVPPGIPYVAEPGKPAFNPAYQEHVGFLVRGLMNDDELMLPKYELRRTTFDHGMRVDCISSFLRATLGLTDYSLAEAA